MSNVWENQDQATKNINIARQQEYGNPQEDFTRIAGMMTGIGFRFMDPNKGLREIQAKDIPIFMIMTKLSREVHKHKEDNLVDIKGYANTIESLHPVEDNQQLLLFPRDNNKTIFNLGRYLNE